MYRVGDKFTIEIEEVLGDSLSPIYRIKGFTTMVLDDDGLSSLETDRKYTETDLASAYNDGYNKGFEDATESMTPANSTSKTIKASEVPIDTKVICTSHEGSFTAFRYFAGLFDGKLYAFNDGATSWSVGSESLSTSWSSMMLEDGTEITPN